MTSQKVREQFLNYFKSKGHTVVPSAPLVLKNDPSLLFTNAGMNQFKDYFLGTTAAKDQRVTDTQKCLRVSGKHNDLEEVGKDTYHHTFFEMLGNWSFGDTQRPNGGYFKKEAITWAWDLLTNVYGIPKDNLYVTIFEGSTDADNLTLDQEAYDIWKEIIPQDRILKGNKKDNFWEMGDQGPCGPCSEIHVDIRSQEEKEKTPGATLVNQDHPLVIEIWNLVFIQYNRKANGALENLPNKHVDTGMGFERLCMVLQGVQSNYDTDIFVPIIREIETITNTKTAQSNQVAIAIRVVADHLRAVSFAIADGQLPSNTGAGYVIRRILRRAVRYGFTFLNANKPFIYRLVKVLIEVMGSAFTELKAQQQLIENVIKEEEHSFLSTLEQGLVLLDTLTKNATNKVIAGEKAFELYDTFGFPIDLTALILEEKGFRLDHKGFSQALEEQKNRSRKAGEVYKEDWTIVAPHQEQQFIGYDMLETAVQITQYRKITSKKDGDSYQLVFNKTPFYAEAGGQVGDKGYLETANGDVTYVLDTKKENNLSVHLVKSLPKKVEASFTAVVDKKQRFRTACNHTATHLLHQALREVLGTHVTQKGSAVHSKYLRFDFSHFAKLTVDELREVENFVNARIEGNLLKQENRNVPIAQAQEQGAMALFGEKYGDTVRTIRFGQSIELCGGTHVQNTSAIWHFKITAESAVAAGVRRIEAITADAVKDFYHSNNRKLFEIKDLLGKNQDPLQAISNLQQENAQLKKEVANLVKEKAKGLKNELLQEVTLINEVSFLAKQVDLDSASIKDLLFEMGQNKQDLFVVLGAQQNGKAILSCYISKALVAKRQLNAGKIVRELGKYIQGGGGGQPFFATAGGKNIQGLATALEKAKAFL